MAPFIWQKLIANLKNNLLFAGVLIFLLSFILSLGYFARFGFFSREITNDSRTKVHNIAHSPEYFEAASKGKIALIEKNNNSEIYNGLLVKDKKNQLTPILSNEFNNPILILPDKEFEAISPIKPKNGELNLIFDAYEAGLISKNKIESWYDKFVKSKNFYANQNNQLWLGDYEYTSQLEYQKTGNLFNFSNTIQTNIRVNFVVNQGLPITVRESDQRYLPKHKEYPIFYKIVSRDQAEIDKYFELTKNFPVPKDNGVYLYRLADYYKYNSPLNIEILYLAYYSMLAFIIILVPLVFFVFSKQLLSHKKYMSLLQILGVSRVKIIRYFLTYFGILFGFVVLGTSLLGTLLVQIYLTVFKDALYTKGELYTNYNFEQDLANFHKWELLDSVTLWWILGAIVLAFGYNMWQILKDKNFDNDL